MTTTILTFDIPARIPSNNKLLRMHWGTRRTLIQRWHGYVSMFIKCEPIDTMAKMTITEIVPKGGRRLDETNLLAAADKLIIDAMVKLKMLKNDSPKYLHVEASSEHGRYWGVRITIEYRAEQELVGHGSPGARKVKV